MTTPLAELATHPWDVAVVGAGLAGPMAAYGLARSGLRVLLIDRSDYPRWKVCGCCLNPNAQAALAAAGLSELTSAADSVPLSTMRLAAPRRRAALPLSGWVALSRQRLDSALVDAATSAGAVFTPRTLARLGPATTDDRSLSLQRDGMEVTISARLVLAADGLGGRLLAGEPGEGTVIAPGSRIGAGVVTDSAPAFYEPGAVFMVLGRGGYVGLVRLEDGRLDLAAAFDPEFVRTNHSPGAAAARLLHQANLPSIPDLADLPWRGTVPLTRQTRRPTANRVLALGDAAGYVEPFTGEGMAWALTAGVDVVNVARRAVAEWSPDHATEWTAWLRRSAGTRQRFCRLVSWWTKQPALVSPVVGMLGRVPGVGGRVLRYLGAPMRG